MLLTVLAATSVELAATSSRLRKVELMAGVLRAAAADEVLATIAFLSGELRQRQTGVGWASLRDLPPAAAEPSLTVDQVDAALATLAAEAGPGSQGRRRATLQALFAAATGDEQRLLRGLLSGELRQGAQAGLLV